MLEILLIKLFLPDHQFEQVKPLQIHSIQRKRSSEKKTKARLMLTYDMTELTPNAN